MLAPAFVSHSLLEKGAKQCPLSCVLGVRDSEGEESSCSKQLWNLLQRGDVMPAFKSTEER